MELQNLLVLIEPRQEVQPALERAGWIARQCGARLQLLLCAHDNGLDNALFIDEPNLTGAREKFLQRRLQWLDQLAAPLRSEGLQVETQALWAKHREQVTLAQIRQRQPDLVLKSAHHHGWLKRMLLSNEDWQLIRHCPAPLWLVQHGDWGGKRLCAALDPVHSLDKPAALDHQLIAHSQALAQRLGLQAHYLHSYAPLPRSMVFDVEMVLSYEQYCTNLAQHHGEAFRQLLQPYAVPSEASHLLHGFAEDSVPQFVRQRGIDLLLMGAISRSNLESAIIGNTAERVFEEIDCDLLVIKPQPESNA